MTDEYAEHSDIDFESTADAEQAATIATRDDPIVQARPRRRGFDRGLLLASLVIAGGFILIVWGLFGAVTGDEGTDRPTAIENLTPVEDAIQVLQQEAVIVDLQFGYEGRLTIDDVDLATTTIGEIVVDPGEQLELPPTAIFDPGNSIISFQPTEGAAIDSFSAGTHRVRLVYWRVEEGPDSARSYTWSFNVI